VPVEGSDFFVDADTAIVSIGQAADCSYGIGGDLVIHSKGAVVTDPHGRTGIPGIYAAGDLVTGPSTVVEAMASGRRAARSMMEDLNGRFAFVERSLEAPEYDPVPKGLPRLERTPEPLRPVKERVKDMGEVVSTLAEADAVNEALRCLQCGICCECLRCEQACQMGAIRHDLKETRIKMTAEQVIVADEGAVERLSLPQGVLRLDKFDRRQSWSKSLLKGRAAAVTALSKTTPVERVRVSRIDLGDGGLRAGIFICTCDGTLFGQDRLKQIKLLVEKIPGVAHVEILASACHPEKGRRIEEMIKEKGMTGAVVASCVCCNLDFACESCTDQRMRLKHRLFTAARYRRRDMALVNIKDACLLRAAGEDIFQVDGIVRFIRSGLSQLKIQKEGPELPGEGGETALILGATVAGLAAARAFREQGHRVIVMEDPHRDREGVPFSGGHGMVFVPFSRPIRLEGQRGDFSLILERATKKCARHGKDRYASFSEQSAEYRTIKAGLIVLGRTQYGKIPYRRDAFMKMAPRLPKAAFGTLESTVAGVYMASWAQVKGISDQSVGLAATGAALEDPSGPVGGFVIPEMCRGCGRCADICPAGAIHLEETARGAATSWIDSRSCAGCGICMAACPAGAICFPGFDKSSLEGILDAYLG
jgi:heterodisulfide reductase subunit A-like polyferredoxin